MEPHQHDLSWRGVAIRIRHAVNWLQSGHDHLEIETTSPERAALPITETGYRSHFLPTGEIEAMGGATAYVLAWLDEAAKGDAWRAQIDRSRQFSLFENW